MNKEVKSFSAGPETPALALLEQARSQGPAPRHRASLSATDSTDSGQGRATAAWTFHSSSFLLLGNGSNVEKVITAVLKFKDTRGLSDCAATSMLTKDLRNNNFPISAPMHLFQQRRSSVVEKRDTRLLRSLLEERLST